MSDTVEISIKHGREMYLVGFEFALTLVELYSHDQKTISILKEKLDEKRKEFDDE